MEELDVFAIAEAIKKKERLIYFEAFILFYNCLF